MSDPITDIKQTLSNTAATVQRNVSNAIDYTRKEVAPAVGAVAGVVGEIANYVQYAALAVTAITMGASALGYLANSSYCRRSWKCSFGSASLGRWSGKWQL
ncbi:MAG: hypothetical protein IPL08_10995 [Saprospiraceae bacterium]|nr:hypothetical protein [Saprospiraceae bacterium]